MIYSGHYTGYVTLDVDICHEICHGPGIASELHMAKHSSNTQLQECWSIKDGGGKVVYSANKIDRHATSRPRPLYYVSRTLGVLEDSPDSGEQVQYPTPACTS